MKVLSTFHDILTHMEVFESTTSSGSWMVKRARSGEESARLHHEAALLRRAAHPGVVELGRIEVEGDGMTILSTRHAGGCDLSAISELDVAALGGLGAAVATIIADLHDVGISHGAICAEHVVVGGDGRPLLCSFGCAGSASDVDPAADVAALRRLLSERLPPGPPKRLVRLLRETPGRSKRGSARALAASLTRVVPDARLPTAPARTTIPPSPEPPRLRSVHGDEVRADPPGRVTEPEPPATPATPSGGSVDPSVGSLGPAPRRQSTARGIVVTASAVLVVAGVGVAILGLLGRLTSPPNRPAALSASRSCPVVDDGCRPVLATNGRFSTPSGRFAIDLPAAVVVIGRWECRAPSLPAALDPRNGQVWVWDRWPGTTTVEAQRLARVPRATTLDVVPEAAGCDWLEVVRAGAPPVIIHPSRVNHD
jgi:hypothetical protein